MVERRVLHPSEALYRHHVWSTYCALAQEVAEKSTEELARELANPNTPLTSLKLKIQYRTFKGDLPNADDQDGTTFLLQPTLPFPLASGKTLYVRPGISLKTDQPVYKPADMGFDSGSGLGDFTIDVQYGDTNESGFLWSVGATATIPTATESELGGDRWGLGPGFQLGRITEKSVLGGFLNHQWDVGGSGDKRIDLTTLQLFAVYLPGDIHRSALPLRAADGKGDGSTCDGGGRSGFPHR